MTTPVGVIRMVTGALALIAVAAVAGIVVLSANGDPVPDVLGNLASAGLAALAALLASTRTGGDQPTATLSAPTIGVTGGETADPEPLGRAVIVGKP